MKGYNKMICIFKCPSCGDRMDYSLEKQCLVCSTCGNEMDAEDYDLDDITYEATAHLEDGISEFTCPSCGCNMLTDRSNAKHICSYCGEELIEFGTAKGELSPEYIIPCKLTKDDALRKTLTWWSQHETMPKYDPTKIKFEFRNVYIPVWLCDVDVMAHVSGTVAYASRVYRGRSSEDDNINRIQSSKTMRSTFLKIPVNSSTHFSGNRFRGIEPYNYTELEEFNPVYLSGHNAEKTEFLQNDVSPQARRIAEDFGIKQCKYHMESMMFNYVKLESVDSEYAKACTYNMVYALLPIWICSYKYKGLRHCIYINGQTGKVDGEVLFTGKVYETEISIYALASLIFSIGIFLLFNAFFPMFMDFPSDGGPSILISGIVALGYDAYRFSNLKHVTDFNSRFSGRKYQVFIPVILKMVIGFITLSMGLSTAAYFKQFNLYNSVTNLVETSLLMALVFAVAQTILFAIRRKKYLIKRNLPEYDDYLEIGNTKFL